MLKDIVEVKPLGGYRLYLRFEDGSRGSWISRVAFGLKGSSRL
jgi:hypothetical protein